MFEAHVGLQFCFVHGETVRKLNTLELCLQPFNSGDPCKKRNTLRSEKPQFFSWPFIGKKGMLLHEIAKNLLKPRKITS